MTALDTVFSPAPDQMRALLKNGPSMQAVAALLPGAAGRIIVERVHFPGAKPVQLQIRVQDAAVRNEMIIGEWVGPPAADMARDEAARLAKPRRAQVDMFLSVVADPANGLILRRPGFDAKLPGLRLLHDPAFAADCLGPSSQVSLVAHRLGKRAVLRIAGRDGLRYARLRPVTSGSGQKAYDRHMALWSALQGHQDIAIPRPIGFDPSLGMALFEAVPGVPPVFSGLPGLLACRSVTRALAALQSLAISVPQHSAADEINILATWAGRLAHIFPDLAARVQPILDRLGDQLTGLAPTHPVLCHRDLHEGQILLEREQTGLLDFDTLRRGDPALDLGNLQAHLILATLRDGQSRESFVTALQNAAHSPSARISLWRQAALLRLAMIYAFSAEAPSVIHGLLAAAA
jgi:aminoglycoside phosphotransferase (APT) family kinase protein